MNPEGPKPQPYEIIDALRAGTITEGQARKQMAEFVQSAQKKQQELDTAIEALPANVTLKKVNKAAVEAYKLYQTASALLLDSVKNHFVPVRDARDSSRHLVQMADVIQRSAVRDHKELINVTKQSKKNVEQQKGTK